MSVFVEITSNELKVTEAENNGNSISVKSHQKAKLAVPNGDVEDVSSILGESDIKTRKMVFIDSSNNPIYYDMKVPNIRKDKILAICRNELKTKLNRQDELLVDYFDIKNENESEKRILISAMALPRVRSLVGTSKNLKIKKNEIRVAYDGVFNYMYQADLFTEKEATVAIEVNDNFTRSWLFENDEYVNLRSTRNRSSEYLDLLDILSDDISKLQQFQSTRRRAYDIKKVYLFGNSKFITKMIDDLNNEFQNLTVEKMPELASASLPDDYDYLDNIYSMGIILGDK